jgi:hypothetical protein
VDRFSCGADLDYSSQLDEHDLVSEDCESVILGYGDYVAQDLPPTSLDAPILYDDSRGCADYCPDARAVYIREARFSQFAVGAHPGRLLARASFPAGPFPPRSRPVRLSKEGKAEVRRLGVLRVEVTAGDSRYLTILRAP